MKKQPEIDWLARRFGGIIDFRLDDDPADIEPEVMQSRIAAYYKQQRGRMDAARRARPFRGIRIRAIDWRELFGEADD